jgi:DNA-binding transcriptional MocR family regulator
LLLPIRLDKESTEPLYQQVKRHLAQQIDNGLLPPGTRLPPTRTLATELGVSRSSVVTAYEELQAEGLIHSQVARGTFVAERFPPEGLPVRWSAEAEGTRALHDVPSLQEQARRPNVISFSQGAPAEEFLPVELVRQIIDDVLARDGAAAVTYEVPEGYPPLREAIAAYVASLGIEARADEVLVTGGCQQALDLAVQALLNPGDTLLTSNPTYLGILDIARARAVRTVGVPVDDEGLIPEHLPALIEEHRPRLLYVAPTYHNPTGSVMPAARRRHLLDVAARYSLPVLEDGVYQELSYGPEPPPPLKALDEDEFVLYASGFSKVVLPGMRIGYLLVGGTLRERLVRVKQAADICTPALNQRAIHAFLEGGHLAPHLEHVRQLCRQRRDTALHAAKSYLPQGSQWSDPQGGQYLWVELPPGPSAADLYVQALRHGVAFAMGDVFYTDEGDGRHLRLNMLAHPPETIEEGMRRLGEAWEELVSDNESPGGTNGSHILY